MRQLNITRRASSGVSPAGSSNLVPHTVRGYRVALGKGPLQEDSSRQLSHAERTVAAVP